MTLEMRPFERDVVGRLAEGRIPREVLERVFSAPADLDHTGVGYFLTVRDAGLPRDKMVLDTPLLVGRSAGLEVGFVVFIEDHELTLECHGWGTELPDDVRERAFEVTVARQSSAT